MAVGFLFIALSVSPLHAETDNKLALGLSFSIRHAPDDSSVASGGHEIQFEFRFGHPQRSGWLGELRVRPLMGGTWLMGRAR